MNIIDEAYRLRWAAFENIYPRSEMKDRQTTQTLSVKFSVAVIGPDATWDTMMMLTNDNTHPSHNDIMHRLRMLAGPHGKAIYRAMQLQRDT